MLLLTDWVLEMLALDKTIFRTMAISTLLVFLLTISIHLLLKAFNVWYGYYINCQKLRCFPEPPRRNWFLGHLGMVSTAKALRLIVWRQGGFQPYWGKGRFGPCSNRCQGRRAMYSIRDVPLTPVSPGNALFKNMQNLAVLRKTISPTFKISLFAILVSQYFFKKKKMHFCL